MSQVFWTFTLHAGRSSIADGQLVAVTADKWMRNPDAKPGEDPMVRVSTHTIANSDVVDSLSLVQAAAPEKMLRNVLGRCFVKVACEVMRQSLDQDAAIEKIIERAKEGSDR